MRRQGESHIGAVGKETFDVELTISLSTGEILAATMNNLVEATQRECTDAELTTCGGPRPFRTFRRIEMSLVDSEN